MLRVAMLSKWHVHARDYAGALAEGGKAEIVAVWDERPERGRGWAEELHAEFVPELDLLLAREDIDAVICDTPTSMHKDVMIACARAGKHIFTEKVLALTTAEAEEIAREVKDSGVVFTISYPLRRNALMRYAKRLVDEGAFGKIGMVRMRRSHSGVSDGWLPEYWFDASKTGGGAMMDLGAHPMYLLSWLCGRPKRVSGIFNRPFGHSDDPLNDENAVATIEFENGIIGISETSFISYGTPDALEIYGSDATLLIWGDEIKLTARDNEGARTGYFKPDGIGTDLPSALDSFVDACLGLAPAPADMDVDSGVDVSELMELAYISNQTGALAESKRK